MHVAFDTASIKIIVYRQQQNKQQTQSCDESIRRRKTMSLSPWFVGRGQGAA